MRAYLFGILTTVLSLSSPCRADDGGNQFMDGNKLSEVCMSKYPLDRGICLGYVQGVADTWEAWRFLTRKNSQSCIPLNVSAGQLEKVVVKHLQEHPEMLHEAAGALVIRAIHEAWCPDARP